MWGWGSMGFCSPKCGVGVPMGFCCPIGRDVGLGSLWGFAALNVGLGSPNVPTWVGVPMGFCCHSKGFWGRGSYGVCCAIGRDLGSGSFGVLTSQQRGLGSGSLWGFDVL